jgi:hypothetical protein
MNKNSKIQEFLKENSSKDKSMSKKMESSSMPMISDWEKQSLSMADQFIFTTLTTILENFTKNQASLKDLLNLTRMISGPQLKQINGSPKKMHR